MTELEQKKLNKIIYFINKEKKAITDYCNKNKFTGGSWYYMGLCSVENFIRRMTV